MNHEANVNHLYFWLKSPGNTSPKPLSSLGGCLSTSWGISESLGQSLMFTDSIRVGSLMNVFSIPPWALAGRCKDGRTIQIPQNPTHLAYSAIDSHKNTFRLWFSLEFAIFAPYRADSLTGAQYMWYIGPFPTGPSEPVLNDMWDDCYALLCSFLSFPGAPAEPQVLLGLK